ILTPGAFRGGHRGARGDPGDADEQDRGGDQVGRRRYRSGGGEQSRERVTDRVAEATAGAGGEQVADQDEQEQGAGAGGPPAHPGAHGTDDGQQSDPGARGEHRQQPPPVPGLSPQGAARDEQQPRPPSPHQAPPRPPHQGTTRSHAAATASEVGAPIRMLPALASRVGSAPATSTAPRVPRSASSSSSSRSARAPVTTTTTSWAWTPRRTASWM